jgi:hypothetical protein
VTGGDDDEAKTADLVRLINERLNQGDLSTATSTDGSEQVIGLNPSYAGNLNVENIFGVIPSTISFEGWESTQSRQRASSTVSSIDSLAVRVYDNADLAGGWQPVEDTWAIPEGPGIRRATFDQSDFMRYRRRPAWKCKHCEGVGWSEEEPCDGCGRYLPENYQVPTAPRMRMMREGDWICESCNNTNWEWRTQCNRCHTCRAGVPAQDAGSDLSNPNRHAPVDEIVKQRLRKRLSTHPAGVFKDNDWVCTSCGNINWDWRFKCHQCAHPKPTGASTAVTVPATGLPPRNAHRLAPNSSS